MFFQAASQPRDVPPNVPTVAKTNSPARLVVPVLPDENVLPVPLAADCRSTVVAPETSSAVTLLLEAAGNVTVIWSLTARPLAATAESVTSRSPLESEMSLATANVSPLLSVAATAPAEVPVSWTVTTIRSPAPTPPVRQTAIESEVRDDVEEFVAIWLTNFAELTVTVLVAVAVALLVSVTVTVTG